MINEALGNRCTPIQSMEDTREATSSSDCTPQQRLTTAFDEPNLYPESNRDSTAQQSRTCDNVKPAGRLRQKWSKEENILLWKCYLLSKPKVSVDRVSLTSGWIMEVKISRNKTYVTRDLRSIRKAGLQKSKWKLLKEI